jgi:hypothetical protein
MITEKGDLSTLYHAVQGMALYLNSICLLRVGFLFFILDFYAFDVVDEGAEFYGFLRIAFLISDADAVFDSFFLTHYKNVFYVFFVCETGLCRHLISTN